MEDGSKLYTTLHICRKNKCHSLCYVNIFPLLLNTPVPMMAEIVGWGSVILTSECGSVLSNLLSCSSFYSILKCPSTSPPQDGRKLQRNTCPFYWPSEKHLLFLQLVVSDIGLYLHTQVRGQGERGLQVQC